MPCPERLDLDLHRRGLAQTLQEAQAAGTQGPTHDAPMPRGLQVRKGGADRPALAAIRGGEASQAI